jgi:hypothetical protein
VRQPKRRARRLARPRPALRRVGIGLLVLAGVTAVGIGAYQFLTEPEKPALGRAGSVLVPGAPRLTIRRVPMSYRIVYRVESLSDRETAVSTEDVHVGRPFDSRTEARVGAPPGSARQAVQVTSFGALETLAGDTSQPLIIQTVPDLAAADVRADVDLPELEAQGLTIRREVRRIAGRPCQVFRFGESILSGAIKPYAAGSASFADECIDEAGLVLEDLWVTNGTRTRRKVATSVREGDAPNVAIKGPFVEPKQGGGAVKPVDPASHSIGETYDLPAPAGFTYRGRWAVVPPQPIDPNDPNGRSRLVAGTADVWVRGADVVILDQGGTLGGGAPFADDETAPAVEAGAAGRGRLVLGLRMNQVRVLVGGGHYVKLLATLPSQDLRNLASTLVKLTGGTGLRYL